MSSWTPIKIRGKKLPADLRHSVQSLLTQNLDGKRPQSRTSTIYMPPAKRHYQSVTNSKLTLGASTRVLSSLERLPIEILEEIFFYCLNLNLPQASLIICRKLTSNHVKTRLTLGVCSTASSNEYPSALARIIPTVREQAEIQSAILQAKWMTIGFLQGLITDYIVKTLVQELALRKVRWLGKGSVVSKASESTIRQYLEDNVWRLDRIDSDGIPAYWELKWSTGVRDSYIGIGIGLADGLVIIWEALNLLLVESLLLQGKDPSIRFSKWRVLSCVKGCRLPQKLLHWPWTDEKCQFLEMAVRGNASVDWIGTTSGEVAKKGMLQAIRENNARAVRALLDGNESWRLPQGVHRTLIPQDRDSALSGLSTYTEDPLTRGVGVRATVEHLRMAIVDLSCHKEVVDALAVNYWLNEHENYDENILAWIYLQQSLGNPRAFWLGEALGI